MQSGKLVANGRNRIRIALKAKPIKIKVWFEDDPHIIPCNPHHHHNKQDHLHHYVDRADKYHDHKQYILTIEWHTHDLREIEWKVWYESDLDDYRD